LRRSRKQRHRGPKTRRRKKEERHEEVGNAKDPAEAEAAAKAAARARGVRNVVSKLEMTGEDELTLEEIFHSQVQNDNEKF